MTKWAIASAAALVVLVSGCGGSGSSPSSKSTSTRAANMTVAGAVELGPEAGLSSATGSVGEDCSLPEGYADLPGGQVAITDDAGKTLGFGKLEAPMVVSHTKDQPDMVCSMAFTILGIPRGLPVYKVTVGHRDGVLRETEADLAGGLTLTIK